MARVLGIDPGTVSFDVCGLEDGAVVLEHGVPSSEVACRPETLLEILKEMSPLDLTWAAQTR